MAFPVFHATVAWMSQTNVRLILRAHLAASIEEAEEIQRRLDDADAVELVAMLESLALHERERSVLLDEIRLEASRTRRREEERSIRQFVLRALEEIQAPQTAGFLQDYIYVRERVVTKTRGFSPLRRDENKAWRRRPDERKAYIVPCLADDGRAVPSWMARSDWPLQERIVVPGVEALWQWKRVTALLRALRDEEDEHAEPLYRSLIARYAQEARIMNASDVETLLDPDQLEVAEDVDLERLNAEASEQTDTLSELLLAPRLQAAERLAAVLPREELLWGVTGTPLPAHAKDEHDAD
jgi:hypothetical protein